MGLIAARFRLLEARVELLEEAASSAPPLPSPLMTPDPPSSGYPRPESPPPLIIIQEDGRGIDSDSGGSTTEVDEEEDDSDVLSSYLDTPSPISSRSPIDYFRPTPILSDAGDYGVGHVLRDSEHYMLPIPMGSRYGPPGTRLNPILVEED